MTNRGEFGLNLYRHLPEGNLLFSPTSISSALIRALIGARGKTRTQMEAVLGVKGENLKLMLDVLSLENHLRHIRDIVFDVANRIYAQHDYRFNTTYLDLMKIYSDFMAVDFRNAEEVRLAINLWVSEVTKNKIQDLMQEGSLSTQTRLVLVNAVYFKADWLSKFNQERTQESFFFGPTGFVLVPTMYQRGYYSYAVSDSYQAIRLPFASDGLSDRLGLFIFLPHTKIPLSVIERELCNYDRLKYVLSSLYKHEVDLFLPRFEINWGAQNLVGPLQEMGIVDAFNQDADFSGIEPNKELRIAGVYHQAFGSVNEEGAEMTAATSINFELKAIKNPEVFRADHPFMFMVKDDFTGEILFMGRYVGPSN
jgi:serpin B